MSRYVYLGDRMTAPRWKGQACDPVRRADGKCVVGRSMQVVRFADGTVMGVLRRRLRVSKETA